MTKQFVNLHTHTNYSKLDGASKIPEIVSRAKSLNNPALAITDHGNVSGIIDFYKECKKQGIKPILGEEFYFCDDRTVKEKVDSSGTGQLDGSDKRYYHLTVLAKDNDGYKSLIKLSSDAFINGFYFKPRTDYEFLSENSKGIIVGSGCLGGPVLQPLLHDNYDLALKTAGRLQEIVGKENFFVELMDHGLPEQAKTNPFLLKIAKTLGAPAVSTQDSHYSHPNDAKNHAVLLCCQTGAKLSDPKRFKFHNDEYYLKSPEQMYEIFADYPEVCDNTLAIAEMCDVTIDFDSFHLPVFPIPPQYDDDNHMLKELVWEGLHKRYGKPDEVHIERARYELSVIKAMGLSSYFLIFWDLVNYCNGNRIMYGPGRGSAASSIVAYALDITRVDPIKYKLIFERFLNPERIALADVDFDTDTRYRDKLIQYTRDRYGDDSVAQIITFGRIKARTAIRDSARVLGFDYKKGDMISKALPPLLMGKDTPLDACLEFDPKYEFGYENAAQFRELYETDQDTKTIVDTARGIEGAIRQDGVHAAAVVIGDRPLIDLVPLQKKKDGPLITQYDKDIIEELGLLKMDYLGLRNLDVISDTLKRLDLPQEYVNDIPENDSKALNILKKGYGIGLFQVESPNMRDLLRDVSPDSIEEISAVLALYRPGPMAENMHKDYADRKHGRKFARIFHDDAKDLLEDTYYLPIYQEQIFRIAQKFAGFSYAEADILRKAMGKKIPELMAEQRDSFVKGCVTNGYREDFSNELFDIIEEFSGYSFALSHSVSYGTITYWTAYFKAHHPKEYMASLCSSVSDDLDKTGIYLYEARQMGLKVYPPNVNTSDMDYGVEEDGIRIGFKTLKNMGEAAVGKLIKEREKNGPFKSLYELAWRFNPNINTLKSLAYSGALDEFGTRQGIAAVAEDVLKSARKESKKVSKDQGSLFSVEEEQEFIDFDIPETEFSDSQKLKMEKETLGVYISGHPLDEYENTGFMIDDLKEVDEGSKKEILCLVDTVNVKTTKKGQAMAILEAEDQTGKIEVVVFPRSWSEHRVDLSNRGIFRMTLRAGTDFRDERNYVLQSCESIDDSVNKEQENAFGIFLPKRFHLDLQYMSKLKGLVLANHGASKLRLYVGKGTTLKTSEEYLVEPSSKFKEKVKELFSEWKESKE